MTSEAGKDAMGYDEVIAIAIAKGLHVADCLLLSVTKN
jgi:hypothetical protein